MTAAMFIFVVSSVLFWFYRGLRQLRKYSQREAEAVKRHIQTLSRSYPPPTKHTR